MRGTGQPALTEEMRRAASDWVARQDAGLSASEDAAWRAWLASDPRHREAYDRYAALWGRLERPRMAGEGTRLQRDVALAARGRRRRGMRAAGLAAVVTLAVTAGLTGRWFHSAPAPAGAGSMAITGPERLTLPDGSVLEHPRGAEVVVDFGSPLVRRVTLGRGEVHLEVAADPARPFIVAAAGVEFRAVGTAFSVHLGSASVELLVTEGKVVVDGRVGEPTAAPSAAPLVGAGQRLTVGTAGGMEIRPPESCPPAEMARRLAWRSPRAEFTNSPLRNVVAFLNARHEAAGGPRYELVDPELAAACLTGVFLADDADAFIGILEGGFGVVAERRGTRDIVLSRRR
ncbi:MAG: FecR family protein [Opitutaceae bacterium]